MIATFGEPEDITPPGLDGNVFRFPVMLIDRDDIGTPRQLSKTRSVRIRAEVSRSRICCWGFGRADLVKVMFEIVKERLITTLTSGAWKDGDLAIMINTSTHKGPCPFDPALIQEPAGAVVEIEVRRPIGFIRRT
jgi:hypothetical protein